MKRVIFCAGRVFERARKVAVKNFAERVFSAALSKHF